MWSPFSCIFCDIAFDSSVNVNDTYLAFNSPFSGLFGNFSFSDGNNESTLEVSGYGGLVNSAVGETTYVYGSSYF